MAELTYTQRLFSRQVEQTARERQAFEKEKQRFAKSYADGRKVDRYGRTCCNSAASMDPQAQAQQPPPADDLDDEDLRMMAGYMDGTVTDQEYADYITKKRAERRGGAAQYAKRAVEIATAAANRGESLTSCECYSRARQELGTVSSPPAQRRQSPPVSRYSRRTADPGKTIVAIVNGQKRVY